MKRKIVNISLVRRHKAYEPFAEIMTQIEYLLRDPALLRPEAVHVLLDVMPIVAKAHGRYWHYVAGHRTYVLAVSVLGPEAEVPIFVLQRLSPAQIGTYVAVDILLKILSIQIKQKSQLGTLVGKIKTHSAKTGNALLSPCTQQRFAADLGCSKNTIFPPKKEKTK
jgi:hypothetical protein